MVGNHRPIKQRKEDQFVPLDVDGERLGGFDRSSPVQGRRQADQPGAAHRIDLVVSGTHIGQSQFGSRLHHKGVVGPRRRSAAEHHKEKDGSTLRQAPPQQAAQCIGDQQIGERQKQRRGQQRRPKIDLAATREGLACGAGGQLSIGFSSVIPVERLSARLASVVP